MSWMQVRRSAEGGSSLSALVLLAALLGAGWSAGTPAAAEGEAVVPRVLYLDGMEIPQAAALLRAELQVRRLAAVAARQALIVMEEPARAQRAEALLQERGVLRGASEPHGSIELRPRILAPTAARTFYLEGVSLTEAETLLRTLYGAAEVAVGLEDHAVMARSVPEILDAAEALFRELGVLAGTADRD